MMFSLSLLQTKKLLILGVALVLTGLTIVGVLLLLPQVETVSRTEIDVTTRSSYLSPGFLAGDGHWFALDLHSTNDSTLHVRGPAQGLIFQSSGTAFEYKVPITAKDVYQIEVANNDEGYWSGFTWIDPIEINIVGSLSLETNPPYYDLLISSGLIMLAVGLLLCMYREDKERQKASFAS